jgi:hypothetical protein
MTPEQLAAIQSRATRPRHTVAIVLDGDLREQIERAEAALETAQKAPDPADRRLSSRSVSKEAVALQSRLDDLHQQAAGVTLHVVLEGLPRTPYRELVAAHPARRDPADPSKLHEDDGLGVHMETFPPVLVRSCVIGHKPDPEDGDTVEPIPQETLDWLFGVPADPATGVEARPEFVTDRQMQHLWVAAFDVNRGNDAIPLPRPRSTTRTADSA